MRMMHRGEPFRRSAPADQLLGGRAGQQCGVTRWLKRLTIASRSASGMATTENSLGGLEGVACMARGTSPKE